MDNASRLRIEVSVPARAEDLGVLRLVVRSVCAGRGATVDDIDDAALAVQEAGIALIEAGESERLRMELEPTAAGIEVRLSASTSGSLPTESMSLSVIKALAHQFEASTSGGPASIRMVLCAPS